MGWVVLACTVAAFGVAACGDSPVADDDDHLDPVGVAVVSGNTDLVTITGFDVRGAIFVEEGGQTDPVDILFFDNRGDRFTPQEADEWLRVTVTSAPFAEWVPDAPGAFSGVFRGVTAGSTTVRFELMHGPVGSATSHVDFGTPGAPITVTN